MPPRRLTAELMDDPGLDPALHAAALRGLARLNRISGSARAIHRALADLLRPGATLRLLDLATGSADVPIALAARLRHAPAHLELSGCDASSVALAIARQRAAAADVAINLFVHRALADPLPTDYDVITCSLFLHHLPRAQAVELLRRMAAAARRRVIVSDLRRSSVNRVLVAAGAHLLSRSPVVHEDAVKSVDAAFTPAELLDLADEAGLHDARLIRCFPARMLLTWDRRA